MTTRAADRRSDRPRTAARRPASAARAEALEARSLFAATVFHVDPTQSALSLSGTAFGIKLDEQADGSLRAAYDGAIVADVTADSVRLLGGGSLAAESRGRFSPGDAAGNYAAEADGPFGVDLGELVVRGLRLAATSGDLPLAAGAFAANGVRFRVDQGTIDYDTVASGSDDEDLAGSEGGNRSRSRAKIMADAGGVRTLTVPVDVNVDDTSTRFRLRGKLVAVEVGTGPVIDASGPAAAGRDFAGAFNAGESATVPAADPALTVTDFGSTSVAGGTIVLADRPDGSAESVAVDTTGTGVTASAYDPATGTITLSGTAPLAGYQALLRTLRYANAAATPTLGERTISLTLSDGATDGPTATSVIDVNDPEVATLSASGTRSVRYTDADGSVVTFAYKGPGSAALRFAGATDQADVRGGVQVVGGDGFGLRSVTLTGTTLLSALTAKVTGGSDGQTSVPSVSADASVGTLGGKGLTLAGPLAVTGTVSRAEFRNLVGATVTAGTIRRLTAFGSVADSRVTLTDPFDPLVPALGTLTVAGPMTGSTVAAAGGVGTVSLGGMAGSQIYVGRTSADPFPDAADDFAAAPAGIKKVRVGARSATAPTFAGSVVAARTLGSVSLSLVDTANAATAFGLVADSVASLSARNVAGQSLRIKSLDDPAVAADTLAATGFTFGDFAVRVV